MSKIHAVEVLEALDAMVVDGHLDDGTADAIRLESQRIHDAHEAVARRYRVMELLGYVGAGLVLIGLLIIGGSAWTDLGAMLQLGLPALAGVLLLGAAWLVARATPGGRPAMVQRDHAARRILVGVMAACSAALMAISTLLLALGEEGFENEDVVAPAFMAACFVGLAVSVFAAWLANGPAPTIAVIGFLTGASIATLQTLGLVEGSNVVFLTLTALGMIIALGLARILSPQWLVQGAGLFLWVMMGGMNLAGGGMVGDDLSVWLGRAILVSAVVLGLILFASGSGWPWAAGTAVAAVGLTATWASSSLGTGFAMLLSGLVLVTAALLLFWLAKRSRPEPVKEPAPPLTPVSS